MEIPNIEEYLKSLKHDLFATKESAKEGISYAYKLIESMDKQEKSTAFIALHVALNSVIEEIQKLIIK